jgi:formylglycine-generating enzyme required for sulfatase activity
MRNIFIAIIVFLLALALSVSRVFDEKIKTITLTPKQLKTSSKLDKILLKNLDALKKNPVLLKYFNHKPETIKTKGFFVDKTEVKQGDFYKFIGWHRINKNAKRKLYSSSKNHGLSGKLNVSANGINFLDAMEYCQSANARLPSYHEMRLIAGKSLYPWGDKFNAKPWVYYDSRLNATLKQNSFSNNDTQEGVADLGSMLAEWHTGDYPQGKPGIFGGNAYSRPYALYALNMINRQANKGYRSPYVGFRCVYDKKPTSKTPWGNKIRPIKIKKKSLLINDYSNSSVAPILKYLNDLSLLQFKQLIQQQKNQTTLKVSGEISVRMYQKFLNSFWKVIGIYQHTQMPKNHSDTPLNWKNQLKYPDRAVVGIDFFSSYHFANWAGARLPTYKEMKFLFSQVKPALNPKMTKKFAHSAQVKSGSILNIRDNVSEWTASVDTASYNLKIIIYGGSFFTSLKDKNNEDFYRSIPVQTRLTDVGFRVVF